MAGANTAEATTEQPASVSEQGATVTPESNNVAKFAALLKAERVAEEPANEVASPTTAGAKPTQVATSVDRDALLAAWKSGDDAKVAELLGQDPRDTKVGNSRFAEFRRTVRAKEESLHSEREQVEQAKAQLATERQALQQSTGVLREATRHLQAGDYGAFIETATGKPLNEVLETLTRELVDPSQREIRAMRAEQAQERQRQEQERAQLQQQLAQREAVEARANYMRDLKSELTADDDASVFVAEYGDEFAEAVFALQRQSWDGKAVISTKRAVQKLIEAQIQKHQRFSAVLEKRSGSGKTVATSRDSKQQAAQGNRGARLTSRSVDTTRSQGGASTTPKKLSPQDNVAYFAQLLRQENASKA